MSNQHAGLIQAPAEQPSNPSYPPLAGTWTIDPARSGVSLICPKLKLGGESLEVLRSGAWRVMATLTTDGTTSLVELRLEVDPEQSSRDWLVLRGHGVLDRHALGIGRPAPRIRLDLSVRARRVEGPHQRREEW